MDENSKNNLVYLFPKVEKPYPLQVQAAIICIKTHTNI